METTKDPASVTTALDPNLAARVACAADTLGMKYATYCRTVLEAHVPLLRNQAVCESRAKARRKLALLQKR